MIPTSWLRLKHAGRQKRLHHKMKQLGTVNDLKFIATGLIRSHCNVDRAPDTKRQAPGTNRQTPGTRHQALCTKHREPITTRKVPDTKPQAPDGRKLSERTSAISNMSSIQFFFVVVVKSFSHMGISGRIIL